ncbi:hypothetical protein T05_7671 [Trichinella murrelli]|uniref:Uncharacterized protein n=1 Tax=Trichinella murrelli TaxID=144512 RepID=A0A0V0SU05_9BILA|nr:hypothetical protein T05_7671 [Trichinella murrelli]
MVPIMNNSTPELRDTAPAYACCWCIHRCIS